MAHDIKEMEDGILEREVRHEEDVINRKRTDENVHDVQIEHDDTKLMKDLHKEEIKHDEKEIAREDEKAAKHEEKIKENEKAIHDVK